MQRRLADIGLSSVLAAAAAAMGFDLVVASRISALVVSVAMLVALVYLARDALVRLTRMRAVGRPQLARLEVGLLLACAGFAVARGLLALEAFDRPLSHAQSQAARLYDLLFLTLSLLAGLALMKSPALARSLLALGRRPALLLASSFALMILVATLLLCLPIAVQDFEHIRPLDALFTATSAVCVTGLTVKDVSAVYTTFGQVVILLAIQFGGIGIMTIAAIAVSLRSDSSLGAQAQYASLLDAGSLGELRGQVYTIVATTFGIEALGALGLWTLWNDDPQFAAQSVPWLAVFHSVSAFCHAGFTLFPTGLERFASDGATQLLFMTLIVTGGLGFPVYHMLLRRIGRRVLGWIKRREEAPAPYRLEARVVVGTTAFLIAVGAMGLIVLEGAGAYSRLSWSERLFAALFSSITTRSAGLHTVDFAALSETSTLLVIALMFIGGSPGSTAGGIKTTTLAVLFATFRAELRGAEPSFGPRAISPATIRRASAVTAISILLIAVFLALLTLSEEQPFLELFFETVSAFATVGLSQGVTAQLSTLGRLVIVAAMFVGRIGPMGVALAVGERPQRHTWRLPQTDLQIW